VRSSISSSDPLPKEPETYWRRPIPTAHWRGVTLITVLLSLGFLIFWETYWRFDGYEPSYEETAELWARMRDKVGTNGVEEVVYTGSSRIQFDFDLDVWQQDFGGSRPIGLAKVGTNPRPFLTDLANDPNFRGLLICGVTELLFFAPDMAPPTGEARKYLKHYQNRPLSARSDFMLSVPIENGFASINKEDLSLDALLRRKWFPVPNRPGLYAMPAPPPYFAGIAPDRRYHMWHRAEREPALQAKIQQTWLPYLRLAPPFAGEGLDQLIASVVADVEKIRARGGRVVFVRFPSTGEFLATERELFPRAAYWDRLLAETGAPGIHFEDYEGLSGFNCPEWSHLTRADAVTFTRNLIPILRQQL
jgi:hypothetical protein